MPTRERSDDFGRDSRRRLRRGANVFRLPPNPLMLRWIGHGDG